MICSRHATACPLPLHARLPWRAIFEGEIWIEYSDLRCVGNLGTTYIYGPLAVHELQVIVGLCSTPQ